MKRQKK